MVQKAKPFFSKKKGNLKVETRLTLKTTGYLAFVLTDLIILDLVASNFVLFEQDVDGILRIPENSRNIQDAFKYSLVTVSTQQRQTRNCMYVERKREKEKRKDDRRKGKQTTAKIKEKKKK